MVQVRLFAAVRETAGRDQVVVELREAATVGALRAALMTRYPDLAPVLRWALFAVDRQYVPDNITLAADREVACIPPVSGG